MDFSYISYYIFMSRLIQSLKYFIIFFFIQTTVIKFVIC